MQNGFSFFRPEDMEDAIYEIDSVRRFAGFGSVTEASTILSFRHSLERQQLTEKLSGDS
jgi:IS5 family transposase